LQPDTVHYSRLAETDGVHQLLQAAAERTQGVRNTPLPRVLQRVLSDFYVEYQLLVNVDDPRRRLTILSELHAHIQDAFNEAGVQIMSPHFRSHQEAGGFAREE